MNTPPATPSSTRHHGKIPIVRHKEYNHSITLPRRVLLVQVTVRAPRHPAKRSSKKNWSREQQKKVHQSSFLVRWFVYITPPTLLLLIPLLFGIWLFPQTTFSGVELVWFGIWLKLVWLTLWAGRLLAKSIPWPMGLISSLFTNNSNKWRDLDKALEVPAILFFWWLAMEVSFLPTMKNHHLDSDKTTRSWEVTVNRIIVSIFAGACLKKFQRENRSRTETKELKDELKAVRAELQNTKDERDKYAARARKLELQNEILEEEVELDEGSDGFKDIVELGRPDSQFTSDNDTHGIHIHDDDDEKVCPSTRLVTPSPPPPPETPKAPCPARFTNECWSCGAAPMPTTPDSPNDDLNTGLPSGIGMREVEREKKGAEPVKSLFLGPRKEEGILELGTTSRRLAYKWMGTLDDFWNPFSSSRS